MAAFDPKQTLNKNQKTLEKAMPYRHRFIITFGLMGLLILAACGQDEAEPIQHVGAQKTPQAGDNVPLYDNLGDHHYATGTGLF